MLEQAIIDAKSLKEAAVKTAEEELLKKYSSQIKEAVQNLLEQDEDPLTIGEDTSTETEDVVEELEMKALDGESNSDLEEGEDERDSGNESNASDQFIEEEEPASSRK